MEPSPPSKDSSYFNLRNTHPMSSTALPDHLYKTNPEYFSIFEPRVHRDAEITNEAAYDLYADWVSNVGEKNLIGALSRTCGSCVAVFVPECPPERLHILMYIMDYAFLLDDVFDTASSQEIRQRNTTDLTAFSENTLARSDPGRSHSTTFNKSTPLQPAALAQLKARISYTLLSISPTLGADVLDDWREFAVAQRGIREQQYQSLEAFLETRVVDVAAKWVFTLLRFGLDLRLTDSEKAATAPMERQLKIAMALQNDYFSFDKEHAAWVASWTEAGEGHHLINALAVVMRSQAVELNEARAIVRSKYQEAENRYIHLRDEYIATGIATPNELRWFVAMEYCFAGGQIWSMDCPRYHNKAYNPYNDLAIRYKLERQVDALKVNHIGLLRRLGDLDAAEELEGELKGVVDWVWKLQDLKQEMKLNRKNCVDPGAGDAPEEMGAG